MNATHIVACRMACPIFSSSSRLGAESTASQWEGCRDTSFSRICFHLGETNKNLSFGWLVCSLPLNSFSGSSFSSKLYRCWRRWSEFYTGANQLKLQPWYNTLWFEKVGQLSIQQSLTFEQICSLICLLYWKREIAVWQSNSFDAARAQDNAVCVGGYTIIQ